MRVLPLLFALLLSACAGKSTGPSCAIPLTGPRHETRHEAGGHAFTQHFEDSRFKITENGRYSIELLLKNDTLRLGENSFDVIIHNQDDQDVAGARLQVTPWMPLHGHGVSQAPEVKDCCYGLYTVSKLILPMAGPWELRFQVENAGVEDKAVFVFAVEP